MPVQLNGKDLLSSFSDVEEGTFTPQIADDNLNGSGESQVYNFQVGNYTKIGNRLLFNLVIRITDLGCLSTCERVRVVGLPFTSSSSADSESAIFVGVASSLAITGGQSITGLASVNGTNLALNLWDGTTGTSNFLISELSASGLMYITGVYMV